ncbi:AMP-binding protein [Limibacter armeniacum]|uniref:AMP-binding protein n=1 Tax=Limibacter armeniacum TaxID=466084 RepID=UPI002FE51131
MVKSTTDYPWLKSYHPNMPHTINPDKYESLLDIFTEVAQNFSQQTAFECMGAKLTFKQFDELSTHFAAYLQKKTDLLPGDRIAIQLPNILQSPIAIAGALKAGLIVVNTNPLYTEREMEHQFKDAGVKAIVVLANFAHKVEAILSKTNIRHIFTTEIGDMLGFPKKFIVNAAVKHIKKMVPTYDLPSELSFTEILKAGKSCDYQRIPVTTQDLALLQYTGGTTGVAKGAMLTHRNIIANIEQLDVLLRAHGAKFGEETMVTALPLYHIFSFSVNFLTMLKIGASNILIPNPRDMKSFIKELKKTDFTLITGVNTLFNGMLNYPEFADVNFRNLKISISGGMAVQRAVTERWLDVTGCPLTEGYGLTEASPVVSVNPLDGSGKMATIGLPLASTVLSVRDDNDNELEEGAVGEICVKGPQVMSGYWNIPEETRKTFTPSGWLKTGDIGVMDSDGYFKIVDRKKDMILVSGFNVYPNEIEDVIACHPDVLEVAAIGVPDERSTEAVKVFIVKKDEHLTPESIISYCKENMTGYKIPRHIEFRTELPKTEVGKILRRALKEEELAKASSVLRR